MKRYIDHAFEKLIKKILRIISLENKTTPLYDVLIQNAIDRSAKYIETNMQDAMIFKNREQLWGHAVKKVSKNGLWLEFGVHSGYSINVISGMTETTVHGFDSFEGLQEDWTGTDLEAGFFSLNGNLPVVNSNVILHKGWFNETLPDFLKNNSQEIAFLHLDADTYESTKFVLSCLDPKDLHGTVVVLDEYLGMTNWERGEYLAWKEYVARHNLEYTYLSVAMTQVSLVVA